MFRSENAHLVPNLLAKIGEEDEVGSKNMAGLLRDTTNGRKRGRRFNTMERCGEKSSPQLQLLKDKAQFNGQRQSQKQNQYKPATKLSNLLINFDSQQEDNDQQIESEAQVKNKTALPIANKKVQTSTENTNSEQLAGIPQKNRLVLEMDFEEEQLASSNEEHDQHQQRLAEYNGQIQLELIHKKDFLLSLQIDDDQLSENIEYSQNMQSQLNADPNKRIVIRLATMISRFQSNYYLQPIPEGTVFECVVKRDRCESTLKYHLYDCISLRNFMTIIKDSDGYLVICKEGNKFHSSPPKETVVARIVSNFFGTEFNCTLQNVPFTRGYYYPITTKTQNVITIEYETNFFGLKGPRKISAFIPAQHEHKFDSLNEVYQKQRKKKQKPTVLKFKNKTPKWCKQISAYVLNFGGRATISSIKNFVLVGQNQDETAQQRVLFGKFGRQLFNLDVRYPFSILQAVCLAVSSFDRKLGCE